MTTLVGHQPSNNRYQRGCRCDECRAAHADYMAAWRPHTPRYSPARPGPSTTHLLVTCWCEADARSEPASDIFNGRTWSCGREECHP